jgi:hypothetical protein
MSYGYGKSIVTDGLVFYVDAANGNSYSGSGSTFSDLVGSDDVTLYNSPTYSSDNGGIFSFDGGNEGGQTSTSTTLLDGPLTVDAWAKPQTSAGDGTIIGNWRQPNNTFLLWWDVGGTPNFRSIARTTSTSVVTSETATRGTVNAWNHISVSLDATSLKIYLNGSLQETVSTGSLFASQNRRASIAADYSGTPGTGTRYLDGDIGAVKVYNRVLSADEVLQNYNALKNRFV